MLLCLTFFLTGCPNPYVYGRHPIEQPLTTWRSEDGRVEFSIPEDMFMDPTGIIKADGQEIDVTFYMTTVETGISVVITDSIIWVDGRYQAQHLEDWGSQVISKKEFRVEVKKTTYFQEGDIIVFHRVDE